MLVLLGRSHCGNGLLRGALLFPWPISQNPSGINQQSGFSQANRIAQARSSRLRILPYPTKVLAMSAKKPSVKHTLAQARIFEFGARASRLGRQVTPVSGSEMTTTSSQLGHRSVPAMFSGIPTWPEHFGQATDSGVIATLVRRRNQQLLSFSLTASYRGLNA